jgi:tRNA pseudouridine55 synthase
LIAEDSVLLCDKPAGITSHDLVAEIRRLLRRAGQGRRRRHGPRVGHTGTLDPFATGLLIVLCGRFTRLQRYLLGLPKTYRAEARLGWRSSTGDPDGELTETGRIPASLELPTGRVRQKLPMTSAVRVDGERLYRKAHRGESVDTPEREVTVYSADLIGHAGDRAEYEIVCSGGTYVRSLIETLEDAYCSSLRRTAIGHIQLGQSDREELEPAELLAFMRERQLTEDEAVAVSHGRPIALGSLTEPRNALPDAPNNVILLREREVLAVARIEGEKLRPEVVLV